jgi:phosphoglycolate phosphatase
MYSKEEKIAYAIDKYGISKDKTFYIGDTVGDILEAKGAGVRSIAVTWGWHNRDRLVKAAPDYLVETPNELLKVCCEPCL